MEFDLRDKIGERNLENNILNNIKREIDLLFFIMDNYLDYSGGEIDEKEFYERYNNIKSNSMLGKNVGVYDINNMKNLVKYDEKEFVDNVLDVDSVLNGFGNEFYTRKDKDMLVEYYKKKLREYLRKV